MVDKTDIQRGGPSLGTITITGAQIGKQGRLNEAAEEKDSKHAFLILENHRKGTVTRHVMCAASDKERDGWIARLVEQVDSNSSPSATPAVSLPPTVTAQPAPTQTALPPGNAPGNGPAAGALQRKRSTSRKLSKDVIVTNAQPMGAMPTTGKFANIPSPGMINSLEANKSQSSQPTNGSSSAPISQSSTLMTMSETSQSIQSDRNRPSTSASQHETTTPRANKRQSNMPPTRQSSVPPSRQCTPAYLTNLSTNGMSAPPGSMPDMRERDRKAKSGRFWPSFGKTPEKITRPVFGVPLNESLAIASVASLPAVVFRCIEWLEINKAQDEEGIYRMSGSSAVIKGLKDRFDHEGDVNLVKLDDRWDPHAIAGLLKTFLRDLPTSLLTRESHPKFLAVMGMSPSSSLSWC
jgi:RalA-binding protein 1